MSTMPLARPRMLVSSAALVLAVAVAAFAAAEEWELTVSEIRQAYFLGQRNDDRTNQFLAAYVRTLPAPPSGPHVAAIEVSTPYHQIVTRSRKAVTGYSSQQAERDHKANPDLIAVHVRVSLLPGDVAVLRERGFWKEFDLRLAQDDKPIHLHRLDGGLTYDYSSSGPPQIIGFELHGEFSTHQVARQRARVEVTTHDRKIVMAEFDLRNLK